ncbi:MAG: hypothetical protein GY719_30280 [bacterium]|nr:hypothetical protein [bacterium]
MIRPRRAATSSSCGGCRLNRDGFVADIGLEHSEPSQGPRSSPAPTFRHRFAKALHAGGEPRLKAEHIKWAFGVSANHLADVLNLSNGRMPLPSGLQAKVV